MSARGDLTSVKGECVRPCDVAALISLSFQQSEFLRRLFSEQGHSKRAEAPPARPGPASKALPAKLSIPSSLDRHGVENSIRTQGRLKLPFLVAPDLPLLLRVSCGAG